MHKPSVTYRLFSLTMALLLVFSTAGLTLDLHFCQGKIKRINLIGKAKTCAEVQAKKTSCHHTSNQQVETHCSSEADHAGCCNNTEVSIDLDTDLPWLQYNHSEFHFDLICSTIVTRLVIPSNFEKQTYNVYRPPPLSQQGLHLLFEQFLI